MWGLDFEATPFSLGRRAGGEGNAQRLEREL